MNIEFEKPSLWQRARPAFSGFDGPLFVAVLALAAAGLITMYSAGFDHGTRFSGHARNMLLGLGVVGAIARRRG